jgi:hypothetical protein
MFLTSLRKNYFFNNLIAGRCTTPALGVPLEPAPHGATITQE